MTEKIIIAGSGGQGIMLAGRVLAEAAMAENKQVSWLPSYGAEVRGGSACCMVIISDTQIPSPYIEKADSLIIMNAPSLEKFKDRINKKGLLIINSSLAPKYHPKNPPALQHPFTDIAIKLGNIKVANMVALGCFINQKNTVVFKSIQKAITEMAPEAKKDLIGVNIKALEEGARLK
jgi:2-oxoglutarate ferredoxin oxidoreductase subunit gamma